MCRNIRTLANFSPPANDEEIRASALQFVRKLSGTNRPSRANQAVFDHARPRNREDEARKARERSVQRFGDAAVAE